MHFIDTLPALAQHPYILSPGFPTPIVFPPPFSPWGCLPLGTLRGPRKTHKGGRGIGCGSREARVFYYKDGADKTGHDDVDFLLVEGGWPTGRQIDSVLVIYRRTNTTSGAPQRKYMRGAHPIPWDIREGEETKSAQANTPAHHVPGPDPACAVDFEATKCRSCDCNPTHHRGMHNAIILADNKGSFDKSAQRVPRQVAANVRP